MHRDLVIFGVGDYAQQMHHYFGTSDSHRVVGFTVDAAYLNEPTFCGLPVIPFETLTTVAGPSQCDLYVAIGYNGVNEVRRVKYLAAKALGYTLARFVHPTAVVARGVALGDNTFIAELTVVKPFATLGCNLQIGGCVHIGHNVVVRDHVFFAAGAKLCGFVEVGERCFIGANATLRDRITIGERCVVGAGAVILSDCAPDGVYRATATERFARSSATLPRI